MGRGRARSTWTSSPGSRSTTPGHCHPRIVAAIREQAERLAGVSNLYYTEPAMRLCERLAESSLGGQGVPVQLGRRGQRVRDQAGRESTPTRGASTSPEIVVLDGAFHGRTLGALAATPRLAREDLFGPLPAGFVAVPRDDPDALRAAVGERTAAVMIEPIQGEAGVFPIADDGAARGARGVRRVRRAAGLRRDPVRDGEDRVAVGLRAAPGASGRDHRGQGARRRASGRRLRDRARAGRGARARRPRLDLRRRADRRRRGARGAST